MTVKKIFSNSLHIIVVLAVIISTMASLALPSGTAQAAPSGSNPKILVNEFYRAGDFSATGDEWMELVLIQDMPAAGLQGFYAGDSTGTTASKYSAYQFTNLGTIATTFLKGTIIVVAGGATAENTSYNPAGGDWNIILTTNGTHLSGNGSVGNFAATDVAWIDTVATGSTISADGFGVNWSPTPGALGLAADVDITAPANYSGAYLSSDLTGATIPANWVTSVLPASLTMGQPNGGDNTTYIESLRSSMPPAGLVIGKTAPENVDLNEPFDYIISVVNDIGMQANQVVITDSLPISLTVWYVSDGGELLPDNVVRWTLPTMADGETIERLVSVLAPDAEQTLVNFDYGVSASNWPTFTVGMPVTTTIGYTITPIAEARAAGAGWNGTLRGNVTVPPGIYRDNAFVMQDDTGGMYIYDSSNNLQPMMLGDVIQVKGTLKLFNGMLEIDPLQSLNWIEAGVAPSPTITNTNLVTYTQGLLIQVSGTASWSGEPPAPGTNWSFSIDDGSGPVVVFVDLDTGIDMRGFTSPMPMQVIGYSGIYNTSPQVMPRYQSDIIDLRPPAVTATNPSPGASNSSPYHPITATFSKPMSAASLNNATFTLTGPEGAVSGVVDYEADSHSASFTPDVGLSAFTMFTATLTTDVKDIYDIPLSAPYSWSFTTGAADVTPPAILDRDPYSGEMDVLLSSNVVITFTEDLHPSSLDQEHFILEGSYGAVPNTLTYNPTTFAVTLNPDTRLLPTTDYTVTVTGGTSDWAGLTLGADESWRFTTQVEPPMNVYFGDIHNHTNISDGSGTPAQALAAGQAAGFDFMAISDHSYAINDAEWAETLTAVEAATIPDEFVALRGFEYTQGAEGHINVYNTVRHAVRTDTGCSYCDYTPNLEAGVTVMGFYEWAAVTGTVGLDTAGTVMQFNHPGWINFNDWTYHPEVSDIARVEEVGNGNGTSYAFSEDEYIRSLDYGWKVGASNNADTHTIYWGTNTDHRTGVLMSELTKDALLEALRERRTFATEDKNFNLAMKANGAWMGSEIANSGSILFEIEGMDPDGEVPSLVQLISDQGKVIAQTLPTSASFSWTPQLDITTGVHYFYVRVTQADGDRIVSSPVWTMGGEDIAITDVVIQPSIPTIYSPSLLTARVTNRVNETRAVTVTMEVNGVYLYPSVEVSVPANLDAYANFSWQPTSTGVVTVTAHIIDVPEGDNPDDNEGVLHLTVTDEQLPLILIDAGHGNLNAAGREMRLFIDDLSEHQYNVLKNLDELTPGDLNLDVVKLLIITAPQYAYSSVELSAIADYMAGGGNLWMLGLSDYTGKVPWAATVANRENAILSAIEARIGSLINMRVNDDEIIDGDDNNGYVFGVIWSDFPTEDTTSIGLNVEAVASWSLNSLRGRNPNEPLTPETPGVQIVIQGDLDVGYTGDYWHNPYHTSNTDADGAGDAYIYNPTWVYPNPPPDNPLRLPMAAVTDLPDAAGRIMLYGDSSDPFTTFAYTAGDGRQNELFNLEAIMWLLGEPMQKSTIAEARAQAAEDQPDQLDKLVWVEGVITAAYGEFFNVLYVQDDTGGITVHAPAGDIDPTSYTRGTNVRVVGTVGIYNGDTEIEFFEAEMVQVISPTLEMPNPIPMSTYEASLEDSQGWLGVITGTVTAKTGIDTIWVDDGSGAVRVFLDGYNGDFADIEIDDIVGVTGLISEDGDGHRIRVRNYGMHTPQYPDDVVTLMPVLAKSVSIPEEILPGSVVTYTIEMSNTGSGPVLQTELSDNLPAEVQFGGFISAGGAEYQDGTISWTGDLLASMVVNVVFSATVNLDYSLYGEAITNTVTYTSAYAGGGSASAVFTMSGPPEVTVQKSVGVPATLNPGDVVTYTLNISNAGDVPAISLSMTDTLPIEMDFGEWILQNEAVVSDDIVTWEGNLQAEREFIFTAIVNYSPAEYGQAITNTVEFTSANAGGGETSVGFVVATPELSIEKTVETANDPVMPGDPITYTLVVQNVGNTGALDVHILDTLPVYVLGADVDITTTIKAGSVYTITIPAILSTEVPLGTIITNTAGFDSGELSGESSASFTVWAGEAILSINKTVQTASDPAMPGEPITYTVVVRNDGTGDALGVHITDTLPAYVIGADVDVIINIETGSAFTITIPATLATDVPRGSMITNTAHYEYDGHNNEDSTSFWVATLNHFYLPIIRRR